MPEAEQHSPQSNQLKCRKGNEQKKKKEHRKGRCMTLQTVPIN